MQPRWEKFATESRVYGFDFSRLLEPGETLVSATFTIAVVEGSDPAAAAMLVGSASTSGSVVRQRVAGGVQAVLYQVTATVASSAGSTLIGKQLLACL